MRSIASRIYKNGHILVILTVLFWSGNMVLGRYIAGSFPPVMLSYIRWSVAILILLPFALPHVKNDWPEIKKGKWHLLILSFFGISVYNTVTYLGLNFTQAVNTTLFSSTMPLLIGFWSWVIFQDKLSKKQLIPILISGLGVVYIFSKGSLTNLVALEFNIGDMLVMCAFASYALYTSYLRKRPDIHWLSFLFMTFLIGTIILTPVLIYEISLGYRPVWNLDAFLVLGYICIFPSILAYICFNQGIALIGANRASIYFHLIPFFGAILATLFLKEKFHIYHAFGGILILSGVALSLYWNKTIS